MSSPAATAPGAVDGFLYLSRREVAELLPTVEEQIDLVEATYRAAAQGRVEMPPKPGIHPRKDSFIHAMPSYLGHLDVAGMKWVSGYPENLQLGLPYISGLIVINDPRTGQPRAVLDGAEITAARTAAASGVCIRRWAPQAWDTAAILGCGEQGRYHARVIRALNPDARIKAFDLRPDAAASVAAGAVVVREPRDAVIDAHVVVTAGPIVSAPSPLISTDWLRPACLLLPVDFDFYVRPETIASADPFLVDDVEQFGYYRCRGHFDGWPDPVGTVGQYIDAACSSERVACVNLGVGALDVAFASRVCEAAAEKGLGVTLER